MKTITYLMILLVSFNCLADIQASFGSGQPEQIWVGTQPNDRPTKSAKLNISIEATSDTNGIQSAIGYNFLCTGDQNPNRKELVDSTSTKELKLKFDTDSPLYYDTWNAAVIDTRSCYITWSASAIGTTDSNGGNIGFELNGAFGSLTLNFTQNSTSPTLKKAKSESKVFNMFKESDCF